MYIRTPSCPTPYAKRVCVPDCCRNHRCRRSACSPRTTIRRLCVTSCLLSSVPSRSPSRAPPTCRCVHGCCCIGCAVGGCAPPFRQGRLGMNRDPTSSPHHSLLVNHCIAAPYWQAGVFVNVHPTVGLLGARCNTRAAHVLPNACGCLIDISPPSLCVSVSCVLHLPPPGC